MRIGAFEIQTSLPELEEPHAFVCLDPWVNAGSVGSLTLSYLERHFVAHPLGKLVRPGNFFDFTRYRPTIDVKEGRREVTMPNSLINYAKRKEGNDLLFLHLLEPHMFGETYVDSIVRVLERLGVKRYCLLGGMYDAVPHTRLLPVTGRGTEERVDREMRRLGVRASSYQGPTSITSLVAQQAAGKGVETMSLIVHLPQYARVEENYAGQLRLLELLCSLYAFSPTLAFDKIKRKVDRQNTEIGLAVERNPSAKEMVKQLEEYAAAQASDTWETDSLPGLSPEVERFLKEIDKGFDQA